MSPSQPGTRQTPNDETRPITSGRVSVYFAIRYLTPVVVFLAISASRLQLDLDRLTGVLTAQVAFALATHAIALRKRSLVGIAVFAGMLGDIIGVAALVALTGGAGGPLVFLFTLQALAAGILLSSRAGLRVLLLATVAIIVVDVAGRTGSPAGTFPRGLQAVAALWILGGTATLFSAYNERELRRRNAELDTIRQVTLDIEDTLSLEEIFGDLCRGVVEGFAFDSAAVLMREGNLMRCVAAEGITGTMDVPIELRGRVAEALALAEPLVTSGDHSRKDGTLIPLLGPRGYLAVPLAEDGLLVVTRAGRRGKPGLLRTREIETLDRLAHHARLAIANARLHEQVREMAVTDPLTGLANHGEMQRKLTEEMGRLQRYSTLRGASHKLSLILLDIDHFKRFNDRFGHQAGDAVLRSVAASLEQAVRSFDLVARYGGEEFAVILPETPAESARVVAERIRKSVADHPFAPAQGKPVKITVSVGLATAPENGSTPTELIKRADAALYRSKNEGRNRVTHIDDREEPVATVVPMGSRRRAAPPEGSKAPQRRARRPRA